MERRKLYRYNEDRNMRRKRKKAILIEGEDRKKDEKKIGRINADKEESNRKTKA